MALSEDQKVQIVELYEVGRPVDEIVAATGAPKSSIYYVLHAAGIATRRAGDALRAEVADSYRRGAGNPDPEVYARTIEMVWELQREIGRLEARVEAWASIAAAYRERARAEAANPDSVPPLPDF